MSDHHFGVRVHVKETLHHVMDGQVWTSQHLNAKGLRQRRAIVKFDPESWLVHYTSGYDKAVKTCRGESFDAWVRKWHALPADLEVK